MIKIKYLSKNAKGFSVDDIKVKHFNLTSPLAFEGKGLFYITLFKEGEDYKVEIKDKKKLIYKKILWSNIKEARTNLKEIMVKYGFKRKEELDINKKIWGGVDFLDLEDSEKNKGIDFWKVIEEMGWAEDNDYERISRNLHSGIYGDKDKIYKEYKKHYNKIEKLFKDLYSPQLISKSSLCGWDDAISDYLASIVGEGKREYKSYFTTKAITDKKIIVEATNRRESFAYSFYK